LGWHELDSGGVAGARVDVVDAERASVEAQAARADDARSDSAGLEGGAWQSVANHGLSWHGDARAVNGRQGRSSGRPFSLVARWE